MAWFPRSEEDRRRSDLALLRALLNEAGRLRDGEEEAFEGMLERLSPSSGQDPRQACLTDAQRGWVTDAAERLGIDDPCDDPAERNRNVPRGREVAPAEVLRHLPKAPPGRRSRA